MSNSNTEEILKVEGTTKVLIEEIKDVFTQPLIFSFFIFACIVLFAEIIWNSYLKTDVSKEIMKSPTGVSKEASTGYNFLRAMSFFSWISGTVLGGSILIYILGPIMFGSSFDFEIKKYLFLATAGVIILYFILIIIAWLANFDSYTISTILPSLGIIDSILNFFS